MVIFTSDPVSAGKETGTGVTEPWARPVPGATAGRVTVRLAVGVLTVMAVGIECLPSATTCRSRWSKVTGRSSWYSTQLPTWFPRPGLHDVAGLPSTAEAAAAARSPGRRPDELALTTEA